MDDLIKETYVDRKPEKHEVLHGSILSLGQIENKLVSLKNRINIVPEETGLARSDYEVTLYGVLTYSAEQINQHIQRVNDIIDQIEHDLF